MKKIYIFSVIILLLSYASGYATEFKVSSALEISSAMQTAQPGDTLTMRDGTWTNQRIVISGAGTAEKPILIRAETPGYVILTGTTTLYISGKHLIVDGLYFLNGYTNSGSVIEFRNGSSNLAENCRLTNTAIVNYNPASKSTDYKWISLYGKNNRVDHCYLRGKTHNGTTLVVWLDAQPNYHLIDSNYFAYRPELGVNGGETIRIGTSDWSMYDSYTTVENNYFEQCNGEAEIISNKSGHNVFRYNTFYESEGALTIRHGNYAEVYGNFFWGNKKSNTGGVRIIGEDHKVYNNYFQDLKGTGYRSALTMMNGVPNSPLNRYYQVKRAQVVNNTFVNCVSTFLIGAGKDSELSLPPLDVVLANNAAISTSRFIEYEDTPINIVWDKNIMFGGPLGIDQPQGISLVNPKLELSEDGMYRPNAASPLIDSASSSYSFINYDMDGQLRQLPYDIGADEYSSYPIIRKPITGKDVGTSWYPPPAKPNPILFVEAGQDSLQNAISKIINKNTIIVLTTSGGVYSNSSSIVVNNPLKIKAAPGLEKMPVINQNNPETSTRVIFEILDGGSLNLTGVELDGLANSSTPAKYLVRTDDAPMTKTYNLFIDSCYFHDVVVGSDGNFFRAYAGTKADTIKITNSLFTNAGKEGFRLKDESSNSSQFNVNYFEVTNSTFWNINREAINIYAGDNVIFTPCPVIRINHSTFDNCGYAGTSAVLANEVDDTKIRNSIISNGSISSASVILYGQLASISYTNIFNGGEIQLNRTAVLGNGIVSYNPLFTDRVNGDFTLPSNSPMLGLSDDNKALGDLRWAVNAASFYKLTLAQFGEGAIIVEPETVANNYEPGTEITLTAIPAQDYEFTQWSGDISGTDSIIAVTINSNKTAIAVFTKVTSLDEVSDFPAGYSLLQNYPNPFNSKTVIKFQAPSNGFVKLIVYDLLGKEIQTLVNEEKLPGIYEVIFNASSLTSGVYFYKLTTDNFIEIKKMVLLR